MSKRLYSVVNALVQFAEKILVVTIKSAALLVSLLIRPVLFIGNSLYKFISKSIPNKLPVVFRPLYHFCWGILLSAGAYYLCWLIFSADPQPKDFGTINLFDRSYRVVSTGVEYVGFIMFFATIRFVVAYWRMFTRWLNKFNFRFQFVIHH